MGCLLYEHIAAWCGVNRVRELVLNACASAKGFYYKMGFAECGVEFVQFALAHIKRPKIL
jgi:predicted GNAT family N-acyltransferase